MRIEAVTVCVNYADFLRHTIEPNLSQLDDWVVVTSAEDRETQNLCREYGVRTVVTDVFTDRGEPFNKGRAINMGLAHLRQRDWVLHLDGDVVLPNRFRHLLDLAQLDPECVYGADRVNCSSYEAWHAAEAEARHQYRRHYLLTTPGTLPLGARLVHNDYGYCPIGFFQLWHASRRMQYPTNEGSAEHTDVLFSLQWPARQRRLLPNTIVYHLESQENPKGLNWRGRKSPPFVAQQEFLDKAARLARQTREGGSA